MGQAIEKYGWRGFFMGIWRIANCHPCSKRNKNWPV
ncbi:hypothetical protein ACSTLI_23615 [Vibrio parahaemolyticus]